MSTTSENGYLIGSRAIDHTTCVKGDSGVWYPNFGQGVEIFGWAHDHPAVREDGHSEGCNGYGILGFDVEVTKAGPRITRYHYCRIPVRFHHTTTTEGPTCP